MLHKYLTLPQTWFHSSVSVQPAAEGFTGYIYTHSIGLHRHAAGPTIEMVFTFWIIG